MIKFMILTLFIIGTLLLEAKWSTQRYTASHSPSVLQKTIRRSFKVIYKHKLWTGGAGDRTTNPATGAQPVLSAEPQTPPTNCQ